MDQQECYSFDVVWDYEGHIRQFLLRFYPQQESVEMFDLVKHKTFMKRTKVQGLQLSHLYTGGTVSVLNRQLVVMAFHDTSTRSVMERLFQRTLIIFKVNEHMGEILDSLTGAGKISPMIITKIKMIVLDKQDILKLGLVGQCHFGGPSIVAELTGRDVLRNCQEILGCISSKYGVQDFCYAASDSPTADWTLRLIFDKPRKTTATCGPGILCIIKPHAVREGLTPRIIKSIMDHGFRIVAIDTVALDRNLAECFLEIYKGVVPEYLPWVDQLVSGQIIALELESLEGETYQRFRQFVGPVDPIVARTIRPDTLRATFGHDKILSGVQCTDLERDCQSDLQFIFHYVAKQPG